MTTPHSGLVVQQLSKRFGETQALADVDILFRPGTVHTVFGENGSGKSTLVKILAGITVQDSGRVLLNDRQIARANPSQMRRLGIIAVMQEVLVASNRSVLENLFLGYDSMFRYRLPRAQRPALAQDVLTRITRRSIPLNRTIEQIPLPQQQLVVIARALLNQPQILILDEATAALDYADRDILFAAIRGLVSEGCTVIFISHRMDEVLALSDEATVLRSGRKVTTIPRDEITSARLLQLVKPDAEKLTAEKIDV